MFEEHYLTVRVRCIPKYANRAIQTLTDVIMDQEHAIASLELEVKHAKPKLQQSGSKQPKRKKAAANG